MTVFKVKVSDILVGRDTVRVGAFVAPSPDQTFQRCGELTLTVKEGLLLKKLVEEPDTGYEYALLQTRTSDGEDLINRLVWGDKREAELDLKLMAGSTGFYRYRIVKRRKAGPIEEA
ncbi:Hypothetical Protein OBI_RACECAR_251 [Arthrobacter phage Racecar]|nr:hypothetical protein PBI_RACECAR_43 [Arthrobacter phage Racecar]QFG12727.1 hypothetical protein PBI_MIMI_43 [Arthrobacter phage Mimi]